MMHPSRSLKAGLQTVYSSMSNSFEDGVLDGEIELTEIARCLHSLRNKTGGSDGLVGE